MFLQLLPVRNTNVNWLTYLAFCHSLHHRYTKALEAYYCLLNSGKKPANQKKTPAQFFVNFAKRILQVTKHQKKSDVFVG